MDQSQAPTPALSLVSSTLSVFALVSTKPVHNTSLTAQYAPRLHSARPAARGTLCLKQPHSVEHAFWAVDNVLMEQPVQPA